MSTIGKSSKSIRKQDLSSQKSTALGFKKIVAAHKATAGDTGINLYGLSTPTELSSVGFVQASTTDLTAANLKANRQNVTVVSSARGLLQDYLSYDFSDASRISFIGFTALANEIFTITIDPAPKTGLLVVDATPIIATGTLAANASSFNVGVPFSVNKYPAQQLGAVLVFLDGVQQFRNTGNSSSNLDGNYYEYDAGNGLANQIIFNNVDLVNDRSVLVVSNGLLAERPSGSMMAYLENVQGQVNKLIDVSSALSGLPANNFRVAPSSVDLKTFGDDVQRKAYKDAANTWSVAQDFSTAGNKIKGIVDGSSIPAGYIGETINGTAATVTPVVSQWAATTTATITLSAGKWLVWGMYIGSMSSAAEERFCIATNGNGPNDSTGIIASTLQNIPHPASTFGLQITIPSFVVNLTSSQSYWGKLYVVSGTPVAGTSFTLYAERIG